MGSERDEALVEAVVRELQASSRYQMHPTSVSKNIPPRATPLVVVVSGEIKPETQTLWPTKRHSHKVLESVRKRGPEGATMLDGAHVYLPCALLKLPHVNGEVRLQQCL